ELALPVRHGRVRLAGTAVLQQADGGVVENEGRAGRSRTARTGEDARTVADADVRMRLFLARLVRARGILRVVRPLFAGMRDRPARQQGAVVAFRIVGRAERRADAIAFGERVGRLIGVVILDETVVDVAQHTGLAADRAGGRDPRTERIDRLAAYACAHQTGD